MQLAFGAGALWGNRTDVTGTGIGPDQFGILQDVRIDWDWQTKELWGQFQFPVDIARGQGKITGKAKFARIFGAIYGDLFFGQTPASGQLTVSENEAAPVPETASRGSQRHRQRGSTRSISRPESTPSQPPMRAPRS